jgi:hypothetical protein
MFVRRKEKADMDNIVNIFFDDEADVWCAICDSLGIALESSSYDELIKKVTLAAPEMAQLRGVSNHQLIFVTLNRQCSFA